jgi:hypothetical protein
VSSYEIGDMVAQLVEVIDVDNGKVWCSGDNTGSPVPVDELAPWPDAERERWLEAALRKADAWIAERIRPDLGDDVSILNTIAAALQPRRDPLASTPSSE